VPKSASFGAERNLKPVIRCAAKEQWFASLIPLIFLSASVIIIFLGEICQFHQCFTRAIFHTKVFEQLFSTYILAL